MTTCNDLTKGRAEIRKRNEIRAIERPSKAIAWSFSWPLIQPEARSECLSIPTDDAIILIPTHVSHLLLGCNPNQILNQLLRIQVKMDQLSNRQLPSQHKIKQQIEEGKGLSSVMQWSGNLDFWISIRNFECIALLAVEMWIWASHYRSNNEQNFKKHHVR